MVRAGLAALSAAFLAAALVVLQPQLQSAGRASASVEGRGSAMAATELSFESQKDAAHFAMRQRLAAGNQQLKGRLGQKRKPKGEVLPLEREVQSAETIAEEMEMAIMGEVDSPDASAPCSDNKKRAACKAMPKCEWDSAHGCSPRTGPEWDQGEAAGGAGGSEGWSGDASGTADGAAAAGEEGAAGKAGSDAVKQSGEWWEDGDPDDDRILTQPLALKNVTGPIPRFFGGEMAKVPDDAMDQVAKVIVKANGEAVAGSEAREAVDAALSDEEKNVKEGIVKCDVTNIFDTDNLFQAHPGSTEVSVGIFVMNIENSRDAQKRAAADGEAAVFYADFLLTVTQPAGSTLWTDDSAMWDSLSFRNVHNVYESKNMEGSPGSRRIQASFYYDPDLSMYPIDSQSLKIIVQQMKHTTDEWVFVPSVELNGMSESAPDIRHKKCFGDEDSEEISGKQYSAFTYIVNVRKPQWFAIITAFIPPLLIIMPVLLGHTLGPLSWYPLRFMLSGFAIVSLAFFYDSFLRLLPILGYLTAFDKYIYCLYLWLIATVICLALMCHVFRDAVHDKEHAEQTQHGGEGLWDETPVYLSVALRDDLLHAAMFSALLTMIFLFCVYISWLFLPNVVILLIVVALAVFYFWWMNATFHRLKQKHGLEQEQQGGLSRVLSKEDVERAKGRSFQPGMLLCCCYPPMVDMCLEECCCCCIAHVQQNDDRDGPPGKDDEFPAHLYSPKPGDGGACAICRKAGLPLRPSLPIDGGRSH